ncbi:MAG TPA: 2-hydroxyacid dehydrogenase [Clostridiales bacterium]|nr:2-hydroxyacid dehydrogenase [Clostridiales bacterium]HPP67748.1 2-hydroxyacid dehydrogenase [Clostridiales bacterium]HPU67178.1 2-hydroxyacid dehydrogenase [Clostridiales bacterium]HQD73206.1 2-hydroxyacid dehydrogenase [Clostridiales bacterium]HXK82786.1 2-hydroxyacid dehydrogenase [Clostridiales bacterium]
MKRIAFFDTKPYDRTWFDALNTKYEIDYFEIKLNERTAVLTKGFDGVIAFVNDEINEKAINTLVENGVKVIAMRCAGYNNVDIKAADKKITIVRVPAYSPHAVAEHTMALLLTLNRKIHKAYLRTRDFNFSLVGLMGFDLYGKTVGVIGTGKIGRAFIDICKGFGMKVLAYDPYPADIPDVKYVSLDTLLSESDIISLHCPLTEETRHILDEEAFSKIKKGAVVINTSRGELIDSHALLNALNNETLFGAALDVYEEESEFFFEDYSNTIIKDDILSLLLSRPNTIITSHQGFFTKEAMKSIAETTLKNLDDFFEGRPLKNEVCFRCPNN